MDRDAAPIYNAPDRMKPKQRAATGQPPSIAGNHSDAARRRRLASRRLLHSSRVLIWDHTETQPIGKRLARLGCMVVTSSSIEEAIALHTAQPFHLLLASPGLADEDRMGVLQLLRRAMPKIPLVLVSRGASVAVRIRCQDLRPQYFATPPLEEAELRAILQVALSQAPAPPLT